MYLKSLTLKGFKSFASSTTLQLEPGITCIVGPNGSGKSNVVDALAWVMGEQGAKSLRGGKMEDVIFAGTSGRPPLGRAEVLLTIDNSDGALPIEYAEVTISRTMFRSGGSEYAINGSSCRLLDVQELLCDSGIGREMHVIVGQGQLDTILHATPEDRRGFIEEAAGVLKHRKRKEKALRKLDSTEGNLTRLNDLLSEIRRQLKPLGRQAEVARRARPCRPTCATPGPGCWPTTWSTARTALRAGAGRRVDPGRARGQVEAAVAARPRAARPPSRPPCARTCRRSPRPRRPGSPCPACASGCAAPSRWPPSGSATPPAPPSRGGPLGPRPRAARGRGRARSASRSSGSPPRSSAPRRARGGRDRPRRAEDAAAEEDRRIAGPAARRRRPPRGPGPAARPGQRAEVARRRRRRRGRPAQPRPARRPSPAPTAPSATSPRSRPRSPASTPARRASTPSTRPPAAALDDIEERLAKARDEAQQADRDRTGLAARKDALEMGLNRKDGAGALLAATDPVSGLLGSVAALLSVRSRLRDRGRRRARLGRRRGRRRATPTPRSRAIEHLKGDDLGRAGLLLGGGPRRPTARGPACPAARRTPSTSSSAPTPLRPALTRLLFKVAVVDDLDAARALVAGLPDVTAVTRDGDVLGAHFAAGGSASQPSLIEVQAAVDEAAEQLAEAVAASERLGFDMSRLESERLEAQKRVDVALAKLHESDATLAAVAEELGQYGSQARAARGEAERLTQAIAKAEEARDQDLAGLADLEARLATAEDAPEEEPDTTERERLVEAARAARQGEMDARLALRTSEERARALHGRADSLLRAARTEREARARAAERRERLLREGRAAEAVGTAVGYVLTRLEVSVHRAAERRTAVEQARQGREQELLTVRARAARPRPGARRAGQLRAPRRDGPHPAADAHRAARGARAGGARPGRRRPGRRLRPRPAGPGRGPTTPDGEERPRRCRTCARSSRSGCGPPSGRCACSAGSTRWRSRSSRRWRSGTSSSPSSSRTSRKTRKDLLDIVREVDDRVEQVFTEAYADVSRAFDATFARLFPGGEGRLVLTAPDDMLNTGIEVEARPAGKKVKRLSLLSGGERSLVAVCFLVALFKARPSPFYILDEVEAALDDTNLGRLLEIYEELRENSQLLVITHQKRTMEVGDALYGVTMRGDGVSAVISQRLREAAS